jgi:release factor glutamine methyltransferase
MTFAQAHRTATARLSAGGLERDEAHATARILLDAITSTPHAHLTRGNEVLSAAQATRFKAALAELGRGRPLAYVLGNREFYGLEFRCDERALIPRPETELLVEFALQILNSKPETRNPKLADLGTGTGCIAITIAKHCANVEIFATDVSTDALELARENARTHGVDERIRFVPGVLSDWAAPLCEYSGRFDVIVSNPPYIAPRDIAKLQTQIKDFEPRRALDGGEDGLDCYRQLAAQSGVLLAPGGVLACELGTDQFEAARQIFTDCGWKVGDAIFDLQGIARVLVAHQAGAAAEAV